MLPWITSLQSMHRRDQSWWANVGGMCGLPLLHSAPPRLPIPRLSPLHHRVRTMLSVPYFEKALYELPEEEVTPQGILALADEVEARIEGGAAPRPLMRCVAVGWVQCAMRCVLLVCTAVLVASCGAG